MSLPAQDPDQKVWNLLPSRGSHPKGNAFKIWVDRLLNDPKYYGKRRFDALIAILIVVSTCILLYEALHEEAQPLPSWVLTLDTTILWFFLVEYLARLWVAEPDLPEVVNLTEGEKLRMHVVARLQWMATPLAVIDLLALLPLLAFDSGLRLFRVARVLRLLRLYRVFVYHDPFSKLGKAFRANALLYLVAMSMVGVTILLGSVGFYVVEGRINESVKSPWDALWWTVVTLTTVGYGDTVPTTGAGRLVAMLLMLSGMILLAVFAGVMSQTLVGYLLDVREERVRMSSTVNHVVICGWNTRGPMVVSELMHLQPDREVIVFAHNVQHEDVPQACTFVRGDPTKEAELDKVRLSMARDVVVLASPVEALSASDGHTALVVYTVRSYEQKLQATGVQRNRPIHICAELMDPENFNHLKNAGADEVVHTAQIGSNLVAHSSIRPGMGRVLTELLSWWGQQIDITDIPPEVGCPATFTEVSQSLRKQGRYLAIGVVRSEEDVILNPPDEFVVKPGYRLIFLRKGPETGHEGETPPVPENQIS